MSDFNVVTTNDGNFTVISVSDGSQPKVYINAIKSSSGQSMIVVDPVVCDTAKRLIADWGHRLGYGPKLSSSEAMEKTLQQIIEMYS